MSKFVPVPEEEEKAYRKDKSVRQKLYGECWNCTHHLVGVSNRVCIKTGMPLKGKIIDCCGKGE